MALRTIISSFAFVWFTGILYAADRDIVFADFEGDSYGAWKSTGTAFGKGPAKGTLPGQMEVTGFLGKGLVNSFLGGDAATGTLTSPEFTIERDYITFLIGGGGFPEKTCINLLVAGKVVRSSVGPNIQPGGSERLEPDGWDVAPWRGKQARIEIVDNATGGWGHITIDHIVFTNRKPPMTLIAPSREIAVSLRRLFFPIKTGGTLRKVQIITPDGSELRLDMELADGEPDWWAPLDAEAWKGKKVIVKTDRLPANSKALTAIEQGDDLKTATPIYQEKLRPLIHFSPGRGWTNDPNGLVYAGGEYHLFFQHNPFGWSWGNMHWGHAVSRDLVHWQERGDALAPDPFGPMFSGSAVVDRQNTAGFGKKGARPMVLIYTAAGNPSVQCLAYSLDEGRTFTKYAGNPVVKEITPGNRDPKVIWHEPTKQWVMALYVARGNKNTIQFLTSPDIKNWKTKGRAPDFFECPDLFELPLDGNDSKKKWVLTAANHEYFVGAFDGEEFKPETPKMPGHRGVGFYAAQTYSDIPASDGRRIQIGWLQAPSPGMPFNQAMSVPLNVKLVTTKDGPRLTWLPVRELNELRGEAEKKSAFILKPDDPNPLSEITGEALDIVAILDPGQATELNLTVRGVPIIYEVAKNDLVVNGHRVHAPLRDGKLDLRILADRTAFEVFAGTGLTYVPLPVIPKSTDRSIQITARGGPIRFDKLEAYEMHSMWEETKNP